MRGNRYRAEGPEAEYEPGSRGRVLRNRLGIHSVREMAQRESEAPIAATQQMIDETGVDRRFTAANVRRMHRLLLGEIYRLMAGIFGGVIARTLKEQATVSSARGRS